MEQKTKRVLRFGAFRLVPDERQFLRAGEPVSLPPKVFDLLVVFAENPGTLLEKEFLLKAVWPETFVEEANLSVHVSTLRRALGDSPGARQMIETVPKKGYRFVAAVEEDDSGCGGDGQ
jgi:DNA-binding winged helix-turn-helix (wHTH) protein